MKWAKSFGLLLLSFCLFFGLSPLKQVEAVAYPGKPILDYENVIVLYSTAYSYYTVVWTDNPINSVVWGIGYRVNMTDFGFATVLFDQIDSYIESNQNRWTDGDPGGLDYNNYLRIVKGSINGDVPDYTIYPEPPPEPSWWDNVKQAFMDFVGSEALSDVLSGNWLEYIEDVLFGELWTVKVGEGEDDMIVPETVSATPTPSPIPIPTPIPYSTVIDPGTGEIHYHYTIDVSGTPVPTSSIYPPVTSTPPGPGSGSTIDEPVAVEDYYEPEDSLSVPKLRIFKFLLRMTGNDVDVGMDSLDDNMAVMDATLEDNAEAISGVGDLFQLIPVKWFLLIGTLACFPVIAAMIKSLLGG